MAPPRHWNRAWKNLWKRGETAYFEYHCEMTHKSADAQLWYRAHQPVKVLKMIIPGAGKTRAERAEYGEPRVYHVRFQDGFEYDVYEDELLTDPKYWERRFRPPPPEEIEAHGGLAKSGN